MGDELDNALVLEAIKEAASAGVFWTAARVGSKKARPLWEKLAEDHHRRASACLALIAAGPSADGAGPGLHEEGGAGRHG